MGSLFFGRGRFSSTRLSERSVAITFVSAVGVAKRVPNLTVRVIIAIRAVLASPDDVEVAPESAKPFLFKVDPEIPGGEYLCVISRAAIALRGKFFGIRDHEIAKERKGENGGVSRFAASLSGFRRFGFS